MSTDTSTATEASLPGRPPVTPPADWTMPTATRWTLDNGLTVLAYDVPGQYVLSVRLAVPALPSQEPQEREGVLGILAHTFDEGTEEHSAEDFADLLERSGAALGSSSSEHGVIFDLDLPRTRWDEGMTLFGECLRHPAFPDDEVARAVRRRLADIEQEKVDPRSRASREFASVFYTPDSRVSRPGGGSAASVRTITAQDVREFYRRHIGPVGSTLVVAGDLSAGPAGEPAVDVLATAERIFGAWAAQPDPVVAPQQPQRAADATKIVLLDRPGSVQSELYVGCLGPDHDVEGGWAAYQVLGFVLGGAPQARLDAVLREEKGYTYGVRAGFVPRSKDGIFLSSGSVRSEVTVDALRLLLEILANARDGFTEKELRSGADFMRMTAPSRFATADDLASEAAGLALEGRDTGWSQQLLDDLGRLTTTDLDSAYERVPVGEWTIVVVGDAQVYREGVEALGAGPVEVRPA
ncbi:insulinase family protein [Arsenicicoccus piscis]|nr:pitrilysin family protein [Arsenicicoccus piscis]MCH8628256.1 insulinase family protein [Arsenicicoccus piscis]